MAVRKTVPKFTFDHRFQTKIVRLLYQYPDETRDILGNLVSSIFDTAPMRWTVMKLQQISSKTNAPATMTVLEYEAQQDAAAGSIRGEHIPAYASFLSLLGKPVPDKTYILDKTHDYIRYVNLREFVIDTAEKLRSPKIDWENVNRALDYQRRIGERIDGGLGDDYFPDTEDRLRRRKADIDCGVPTGTWLDTKMKQGGLPPKQLGVVIAPPGRGKTTVLTCFGKNAVLTGHRVLHVTLELDQDLIAEKYDASFSGISLGGLQDRPKRLQKKLDSLVNACPVGELRIKFFPPGILSMGGLRAYLHRLESVAFYPQLIILDYADNMDIREFGSTTDKEYAPLGRLYVALRGLAGEMNIPIWTASQSNRLSVDKENIGIGDLAASFRKAEVADVMVALSQTDQEKERDSARLILAKNRNGESKVKTSIKFDTAHVTISEE